MAELVERNCLLNLIQFDLDVVLRPAVLLSNLIPGLSSSQQKHDM